MQAPDHWEHFLTQLQKSGYGADLLDDIRALVDAPASDLFDVLSYVLFANPPKTRQDRVSAVETGVLPGFNEATRQLLLSILRGYVERGEGELAPRKLGQILKARYGSLADAQALLGHVASIRRTYYDLQAQLYRD